MRTFWLTGKNDSFFSSQNSFHVIKKPSLFSNARERVTFEINEGKKKLFKLF